MATNDIKELRELHTATPEQRDEKIMELFRELAKLDPKDVDAIVVGVIVKPGVRSEGAADKHTFMCAMAGSVPDILLTTMEVLKKVNGEAEHVYGESGGE